MARGTRIGYDFLPASSLLNCLQPTLEDAMLRSFSLLVAMLVIATTLPNPGVAQEWTRFRGPNGAGQSEATTIPAKWTDTDLNWTRELPGVGNGSPVIWGDRIFLMSGNPETAERHLLAIKVEDGSIEWKKDFPSKTHKLHAKSSYASSTPVVDEDRVYFAWSDPEHCWLKAFKHDGTPEWTADLGPWMSQHGFGSSPMLFEDLVIVSWSQERPNKSDESQKPDGSFVTAIDRKTGALRWKTPREVENTSYSVPCIYQPSKGGAPQLLCCDTAAGMYSLNPKTGEPIWNVNAFRMRTVSSPVIVGDLVFGSTGSGGGGNYVAAIRLGEKPEVVYEVKTQAPYVPCVVAKDDMVFLWSDNGIVKCINAADGTVHWTERVGGNYFGSPVRVGDKIYCMNEEGEAVVLAASKQYQLLGRNKLGAGSRATPAVAKGRMYLRTYTSLISIGGKATVAAAR
jgi:outer membrane protein assembly factor BamB